MFLSLSVSSEFDKNQSVPSVARNRNWGLVREAERQTEKTKAPMRVLHSQYYKEDWIGFLVPARGTHKGDHRL